MKRAIYLFLAALGILDAGCAGPGEAGAIKVVKVRSVVRALTPLECLDSAQFAISTGSFKEAEEFLVEMEKTPPAPALASETAYVRALLAEKQGKNDEALEKYRAVIMTYPNTPDAYLAARKVARLGAAK